MPNYHAIAHNVPGNILLINALGEHATIAEAAQEAEKQFSFFLDPPPVLALCLTEDLPAFSAALKHHVTPRPAGSR